MNMQLFRRRNSPAATSEDDMDDDMDDMDDDMDDMDDDMNGDMVELEKIIFSDLNWASAQTQNRIAQFIIEHGYGYETDVVFGATIALLQAMRRGETNVNMEIWLPNQEEAWLEATADGTIETVGHSLGQDWQSAFVIPRYLQEQHPELDTVEDLKDPDCKELFDTPETGGKARLVSCVIGWACETRQFRAD